MGRASAVLRESVLVALAQRAQSIMTALVAAGMCLTVMLTVGTTVGARDRIVSTIDEAGSRSIIVRAQPGAGLTTAVISQLTPVEGIEWVAAFGPADDVHPRGLSESAVVPYRHVTATSWDPLNIDPLQNGSGISGWASAEATATLGFLSSTGTVEDTTGVQAVVRGEVDLPSHLAFLDPVVLTPLATPDPTRVRAITGGAELVDTPVSVLVVVAENPEMVTVLTQLLRTQIAVEDPSQAEISSSSAFADLRGSIDQHLSSFSQSLLYLTFGSGAALVAITQYASVTLRRKDYGRRRALGATRHLIVALVLSQATIVAAVGAVAGALAAYSALWARHSPVPGLGFALALIILTFTTTAAAALIPAFIASTRDPLKELRVP